MAKPNRTKNRNLVNARKKLGVYANAWKALRVAAEIAHRLDLEAPTTKRDAHKLIAQFVDAPKPQAVRRSRGDLVTDAFLSSYAWRTLRMEVLKARGARCDCCGATAKDGVRINVDHIKPRKLFPALALEFTNLQVLCEDCNAGKGNWDQTDWRQPPDPMRPRLVKKAAS